MIASHGASRPVRCAFTLIELIASVVLAAMMMAALMNIVGSALRQMNQLQVAQANRFPVTMLAEQMRHDFFNARGMLVDGGGITLHGYIERNAVTDHPMLRAGRVRYEFAVTPRERVLVRAVATAAGVQREPIWYGVGRLQVDLLEPMVAGETLTVEETGGLPAIPGNFRVTLVGSDGQILWREVIRHHAS